MKLDISKKSPDHKIISSITLQNGKLDNLVLDLYLPQNDSDEILLVCHPNEKQFQKIIESHEYNISGYDEFFNGKVNNKFHINRAYIYNSQSPYYTVNRREFEIIFVCQDLIITSERNTKELDNKCKGYFLINYNPILSPRKSFERHLNGEVKLEPYEKHSVVLASGLKVYFDTMIKSIKDEEDNDKITSFTKYIAEFESTDFNQKSIKYVQEIDDYLFLLSFVTGYRSVCTGWTTYTNSLISRYYRRDIVIPKPSKDNSNYYYYIVEPNEVKEFLENAYRTFKNSRYQEQIKRIIYQSLRKNNEPTETRFLSLFSCLESILLLFRYEMDMEFIQPKINFIKFKKSIKNHISKNFNNINKVRRKLIYDKLDELNRPSFSSAFEEYIKHHSIDFSDLWPITKNKNGVSLLDIRNKLIHGVNFNNYQHTATIQATYHLQIIVDRMLLTLFNWPINITRASKDYILIFKEHIFENYEYNQKVLAN